MTGLRWEPPPHATGGTEIADKDSNRFLVRRTFPRSRTWYAQVTTPGQNRVAIGNGYPDKDAAKADCQKWAAENGLS